MKTLKLFALIFLIALGIQQKASAQCQASFTYSIQGDTVYYTNTSSGNYGALQWWLGNGNTSSLTNPVVVYGGPGIYGVCLTVWDSLNGCQSTFCDTLYINGGSCPAQFSYIDTGLTVYFNPVLNVGYQYSWTFGDGTSSPVNYATHTYPGPGTYTACLIVSQNGVQCGMACMNITVSGTSTSCSASFTTVDSAGYTYFIADNYNANWDYFWNYGDGTSGIGNWTMHQYSGPGPYLACLYVVDSLAMCWDNQCDTVLGSNGCPAQFSYIDTGYTVYFNPVLNVGYQYSWTFGDGTSSNITFPDHTYPGPGTYTACLIVSQNGVPCGTYCMNITISASTLCDASFSTIDSAGYVFFQANTVNLNWDYIWQYGDGTSGSGSWSVHQYAGPGPYVACLYAIDSLNNCWASQCDTIYPQGQGGNCSVTFAYQTAGYNIYLNPITTGGAVTQYLWNFGDGTTGTGQFPNHTYAAAGTYTVCIAIYTASGCTDSTCQSVTIGNTTGCDANFASYDTSGSRFFIAANYDPNWDYIWNYGDGTIGYGYNSFHTYTNPGTYTACLTVIDSTQMCSDTYCDTVVVGGPFSCNATFTTVDSAGYTYFIADNYNANWDYIWQYGDGTSGTGYWSVHQYTGNGPWLACLYVIDSTTMCSAYSCDTIYAGGTGCQALMSISQLSTYGFYFQCNNPNVVSTFWDFGNGNTSATHSLIYSYTAAGTYSVCLTVQFANGCVSTICDTLVVAGGGGCQAYFSAVVQPSGLVNFTNLSAGSAQSTYSWSFGDGTGSNFTHTNHLYTSPGIYYVCLTITDSLLGCSDSYCDTVMVNASGNCNPAFQSFDSLNTWFFIPAVGNYSNYYWTFGDGTFSNAAYPTHTYSTPGSYTVCLVVSDSAQNCSATYCDSVYIPNGSSCQAFFYAYQDTTGASNTWQFVNGSTGGYTSVVWSFGDGTSSTALNPLHAYANPGTYYACLTVFGTNCQNSYCDTVIIGSGSNCIPNFFAMPDSVFGNGNVTFYVYNNCPGWQYVWSFGDSTSGSGSGPFIHQYPATGWYIACVTAYDNLGNSITWCDSVYAYRIGTTGISEMNNAIPVNVFPNPSNGAFSVRFSLEAASPLTIEVLSIEGKSLWRTEQDHPSGLSEIRLDQSVLSPGVYFLRLRSAEQQTLTRFTIQR